MSNDRTRAPLNAEATQPPTGVPANGGSLTVEDVTSPLGANVTSTLPLPVGPPSSLQDCAASAAEESDPWARAELAFVEKHGWHTWIVDPESDRIDERAIQLARLVEDLP